ncbi:MAG: hypothetical protein AAGA72_05240 [Pseudomonadota bacterium]
MADDNFPTDKDDGSARRAEDFDDLNRELAGVNGNRRARFSADNERNALAARTRTADLIHDLTALEQKMRDPAYAAAYNAVNDVLRDAETQTDAALSTIERGLSAASAEHENLLERANRLPDGRAVFRHDDGKVYDEHGNEVSDEDAESIVWKSGAPGYAEFIASQQRMADLEKRRQELDTYRHSVLGPARDRMEDENNPPSRDELDDIITAIKTNNPKHFGAPGTELQRTAEPESVMNIGKPPI